MRKMIEKELEEDMESIEHCFGAVVSSWQKSQCQADLLHCQKRKTDTKIQSYKEFSSEKRLN